MSDIPIAYQGEPGAYSEQAIEEFGALHGISFEAVPTKDFAALFREILGETGLGMAPLENSTAGLVFTAMDLLLKNDLTVIGEHYLPINHFLLGYEDPENKSLEGKVVHSHPQAIEQCGEFINQNGLMIKVEDDTAGSARFVSELSGEDRYQHFAIASERAAGQYGLDVIAKSIQDDKRNTTRFLVLRPRERKSSIEERIKSEGIYKATLSCSILPDDLRKVLALVEEAGFRTVNLNVRPTYRIETSDRIFNSVFYIDVNIRSRLTKTLDAFLDNVRREIGKENTNFFGIYPAQIIKLERYAN